jgi:hypothetical protein
MGTTIATLLMDETRRSIANLVKKYVATGTSCAVIMQTAANISKIIPNKLKIGVDKVKQLCDRMPLPT